MNTRIQVEHPITEVTTGIDIVREQIAIAAGEALLCSQGEVVFSGHAMECRINAEDPWTFAPSPGVITGFHVPGGYGVRVDSGAYGGCVVPPYYDNLLAKLVVRGRSRGECLARMRRALDEFVVEGVRTNIPLLVRVLGEPAVVGGEYHTGWLEDNVARLGAEGEEEGG